MFSYPTFQKCGNSECTLTENEKICDDVKTRICGKHVVHRSCRNLKLTHSQKERFLPLPVYVDTVLTKDSQAECLTIVQLWKVIISLHPNALLLLFSIKLHQHIQMDYHLIGPGGRQILLVSHKPIIA